MAILKKLNKLNGLILQNFTINKLKPSFATGVPRKSIWGYVAIAFNQVDTHRLSQVGPNRLCAEWVLKNGGAVRTVEQPNYLFKDYNSLPPETNRFRLKVIDATGASIMKIGFAHFIGCDYIDTVVLHNCKHLEEDGLSGIVYLQNSLKMLQVSACDNISDDGLAVIGELSNLEFLKIFEMRFVKDLNKLTQNLKAKLPNCNMDIK